MRDEPAWDVVPLTLDARRRDGLARRGRAVLGRVARAPTTLRWWVVWGEVALFSGGAACAALWVVGVVVAG